MVVSKLQMGIFGACLLGAGAISPAQAGPVKVQVKVENLAPAGSVSFAPLHFGIHQGVFDGFDAGSAATAGIISVAELGGGAAWLSGFAAADPGAAISSIGGALLPGANAMSGKLTVDPSVNRYFSFAAMVLPSNDLFIGNDNPTMFQLLDASGNLLITEIVVTAARIWDANSEVADPTKAAFIPGAMTADRTPEGGVVAFDRSEPGAFHGLMTAGGYVYDNAALTDRTQIYRISFAAEAVPEPASWAMMIAGIGIVGGALRRRQYQAALA